MTTIAHITLPHPFPVTADHPLPYTAVIPTPLGVSGSLKVQGSEHTQVDIHAQDPDGTVRSVLVSAMVPPGLEYLQVDRVPYSPPTIFKPHQAVADLGFNSVSVTVTDPWGNEFRAVINPPPAEGSVDRNGPVQFRYRAAVNLEPVEPVNEEHVLPHYGQLIAFWTLWRDTPYVELDLAWHNGRIDVALEESYWSQVYLDAGDKWTALERGFRHPASHMSTGMLVENGHHMLRQTGFKPFRLLLASVSEMSTAGLLHMGSGEHRRMIAPWSPWGWQNPACSNYTPARIALPDLRDVFAPDALEDEVMGQVLHILQARLDGSPVDTRWSEQWGQGQGPVGPYHLGELSDGGHASGLHIWPVPFAELATFCPEGSYTALSALFDTLCCRHVGVLYNEDGSPIDIDEHTDEYGQLGFKYQIPYSYGSADTPFHYSGGDPFGFQGASGDHRAEAYADSVVPDYDSVLTSYRPYGHNWLIRALRLTWPLAHWFDDPLAIEMLRNYSLQSQMVWDRRKWGQLWAMDLKVTGDPGKGMDAGREIAWPLMAVLMGEWFRGSRTPDAEDWVETVCEVARKAQMSTGLYHARVDSFENKNEPWDAYAIHQPYQEVFLGHALQAAGRMYHDVVTEFAPAAIIHAWGDLIGYTPPYKFSVGLADDAKPGFKKVDVIFTEAEEVADAPQADYQQLGEMPLLYASALSADFQAPEAWLAVDHWDSGQKWKTDLWWLPMNAGLLAAVALEAKLKALKGGGA